MIADKDESDVYDIYSDVPLFGMIHNESKVLFKGEYQGQVTSKNIIEYFNTEDELNDRILELGLEDAS